MSILEADQTTAILELSTSIKKFVTNMEIIHPSRKETGTILKNKMIDG